MTAREPTRQELDLLARLATASDLGTDWLTDLKVSDMDDGGMGSLRLAPGGIDSRSRRYGRTAAELEFDDVDGVKVLVSLNLDAVGAPFEHRRMEGGL